MGKQKPRFLKRIIADPPRTVENFTGMPDVRDVVFVILRQRRWPPKAASRGTIEIRPSTLGSYMPLKGG